MPKSNAERQREHRLRAKARLAAYDALKIYDIFLDEFRHVTPFDLAIMQETVQAYGSVTLNLTEDGASYNQFTDNRVREIHSALRQKIEEIKAEYNGRLSPL